MQSDIVCTGKSEHDRDLWTFTRELLHIFDPKDFDRLALRLGLEVVSLEQNTSPTVFQDDGFCVKDELVLDWTLVRLSGCVISSSKIIELRNCIFLGDVEILLEDSVCSPLIQNCAFLGKLKLSISNDFGRESGQSNVEISTSLVKSLEVRDSRLRLLKIYGCALAGVELYDSKCTEFHADANIFETLLISRFSAGSTRFGPDQLPSNPISYKRGKRSHFPLREEHLAHIKNYARRRPLVKGEQADTLEFLLNNADLRANQKAKAHLRYLQLLDRSPRGAVRIGVWLCGGLLKPYRILICSALFILLYGLLYWIDLSTLKGAEGFLDCLYFSAISFTTIGFGDVTPVGFARVLAVVEGFAGVLFSSSLVASIIRKYAE